MADDRLIPAGYRDERSRMVAHLAVTFGAMPTEQLLVYLVDLAQEDLLPHLAEQFSVLGYDGWLLTSTADDRRALIKKALELHLYKGTPWAVKEAIKAVGYPDVAITERPAKRYRDGTWNHDRTDYHGTPTNQWALFRVLVELAEAQGLSTGARDLIAGGVNAYKNLRSWLQHLGFRSRLTDTVTSAEELLVTVKPRFAEYGQYAVRRDGTLRHDGAVAHDPGTDYATRTIRYRTRHDGLRQHNGATYRGATFVEAF